MPPRIAQVKLEISSAVVDAIGEELHRGGMSTGFCILGEAPNDPTSLCLVWHRAGDVGVSVTESREAFASLEGGRAVARRFVAQWETRHEREMHVRNRLATEWRRTLRETPARNTSWRG